jgi:hypothetical protein
MAKPAEIAYDGLVILCVEWLTFFDQGNTVRLNARQEVKVYTAGEGNYRLVESIYTVLGERLESNVTAITEDDAKRIISAISAALPGTLI